MHNEKILSVEHKEREGFQICAMVQHQVHIQVQVQMWSYVKLSCTSPTLRAQVEAEVSKYLRHMEDQQLIENGSTY